MTDLISLRGLRVVGVHGVLAEEQVRAQPFEVDLDLSVDLRGAGASDDLSQTVDYGSLAERVASVVADERHALLERLAQRIADTALTDPRVTSVSVTVRKLRPPVPLDLAVRGRDRGATMTSAVAEVRQAFLGLGSNVGDRQRFLVDAIESLSGVTAVSPLYETDPVGGPAQEPFLNVVVELATALSPRDLLGVCHRLESAAGRVRAEHWGPRTLDVDVLLVGDLTVDEPDLVVPHPRMWERRFVLAPLADIAPDLVPEDLLAQADGRVSMIGPFPLARRR